MAEEVIEAKEIIKSLRALVVDPKAFMKLERTIDRFNVFDVLRSADNEIRHSNILAWLLDPEETHGLGDLFLRRWLMLVLHETGRTEQLDPVRMDTEPFDRVNVHREWNRLDVLVEIATKGGALWVIGIENKVNAKQGKDQLAKYRDKVEKAYKDAKTALLFLTRDAEPPADDVYIPTTYHSVQRALEVCLGHGHNDLLEGPQYLITQYHTLLKQRFSDDDEAVTLAKEIFKAHGTALEYLFTQRPDRIKEVTELLKKKIQDEATNGWEYVHATKGVITFIPNTWKLTRNKEEGKWYSVAFELRIHENKVVLAALLRPSADDQKWRTEVLKLMKEEKFPADNKKAAPEQWFTFYNESVVGSAFGKDLGAADVAQKIWDRFMAVWKKAPCTTVISKMVPLIEQLPQS